MIEFIVIYFLSKKIADIAERKGQSRIKWILIFVGLWIAGEMLAFISGLSLIYLFQISKEWIYVVIFFLGPMGALLGVLITFKLLNRYPDLTIEDVNASMKQIIDEEEAWICPSCFHKNVGSNTEKCAFCNAKRSNYR